MKTLTTYTIHWSDWSDTYSYVACLYGADGSEPGDCYTRVGSSTVYHVLQAGQLVGEYEDRGDADDAASEANEELVEECGPDADLGDGAATVAEVQQWWYDDGDDDCRCDTYGPYDTEEEAREAAYQHAVDADESEAGEDADAMRERMLTERAGEPDSEGEYCVYWETVGDDAHVVDRYPTEDAADAAAELANGRLRVRHPGSLLCGYGVRRLVDGEWRSE